MALFNYSRISQPPIFTERKGLQGALQGRGRIGIGETERISCSSKETIVSDQVTFLLGKAGVCQADYPPSAA